MLQSAKSRPLETFGNHSVSGECSKLNTKTEREEQHGGISSNIWWRVHASRSMSWVGQTCYYGNKIINSYDIWRVKNRENMSNEGFEGISLIILNRFSFDFVCLELHYREFQTRRGRTGGQTSGHRNAPGFQKKNDLHTLSRAWSRWDEKWLITAKQLER